MCHAVNNVLFCEGSTTICIEISLKKMEVLHQPGPHEEYDPPAREYSWKHKILINGSISSWSVSPHLMQTSIKKSTTACLLKTAP